MARCRRVADAVGLLRSPAFLLFLVATGLAIALLGFVIGELWWLDDLAADCTRTGVYDCLVVAKPLNLTGGVGSPANATANI